MRARCGCSGVCANGVTESDARLEIETLFGRIESARPETNRNVRARVMPINQRLLGDSQRMGAVHHGGHHRDPGRVRERRQPDDGARHCSARLRSRSAHRSAPAGAHRPPAAGRGGRAGGMRRRRRRRDLGGGRAHVESAIPDGTLPYWFDYSMDARVFAALVVIVAAHDRRLRPGAGAARVAHRREPHAQRRRTRRGRPSAQPGLDRGLSDRGARARDDHADANRDRQPASRRRRSRLTRRSAQRR